MGWVSPFQRIVARSSAGVAPAAAHEGEEEGKSGRRSGRAAVSEPRMGAATDTKKRVARRARRRFAA